MQIQSPAAKVSRRLDRLLPRLLTLFLGLAFCAVMTAPAQADDATRAAALVQSATNSVQNFLTNPKWQAVRNLLGGARAIFIVPHDIQGGFLLTASGGDGVLLRRHGESWSDPVFLHIGSLGVGLEAGGESQSLVMVIMTDTGVDQLIDGAVRMGGSGGFALADLGAGGSAGGGVGGGLQVLTVSTNKGLFAGGGLQGTKVSLKEAYNESFYGSSGMAAILAENSGHVQAAATLRAALTKAVAEAWGR